MGKRVLLAGLGWLNILTRGGQHPPHTHTMKNYPVSNDSGDPMEKGSRQVLSMCTFSSWQQGLYLCPFLCFSDTHQGSHSGRQGPGLAWLPMASSHGFCTNSLESMGLRGCPNSVSSTTPYKSLNVFGPSSLVCKVRMPTSQSCCKTQS